MYNTGGYDDVESIRSLQGLIDVYLPDLKYFDSDVSKSIPMPKITLKRLQRLFLKCKGK